MASLRAYFLSLFGLLKNRVLLLLILTTALRSAGEAGVSGFLPLYLRDELEYSTRTVAIMLSAAQVAGIVSQPVMGYLSDRIGRKPVMATGTGLVMLSAFALRFARPGVELFMSVMVRGALSFSLHHIFIAAAPGRLAGRHPIDGRLADLWQRFPGNYIALRGRPLRRRVRHQERLRIRRRHPGRANGDAGLRQAEPPRRRVGSRRRPGPPSLNPPLGP